MGPAALYRDSRKGYHLWTTKYDQDLKDLFALQDDITMEILSALEVKLTEGEQARVYQRGTDNIEAYVKALKAIEYHERFNKDDMVVDRRMCEEAIASLKKAIRINPIAPGHYFYRLGSAYCLTGRYEEAISACKKALERSPDSIAAHVGLTATYSSSGRDDESRAQDKEVLRVQPKFSVER